MTRFSAIYTLRIGSAETLRLRTKACLRVLSLNQCSLFIITKHRSDVLEQATARYWAAMRGYMKKALVTPTFLKQKAKQLKKSKSISLHQALEETAIHYGFSNYKNFLNEWESNRKPSSRSEIDTLLKDITSEEQMTKKLDLAVPFLQNNKMSFPEMFELFEKFQQSQEAVQTVCENSFFLDHVVRTMLLEYFQKCKADVQALPSRENFVAKNIVIEDLVCGLITERLNVKGLYTIEFEFEHLADVEEHMKNMPHFNRDPMFGQFEMTIDRSKQVTIANPTIGEIFEGQLYIGPFILRTNQ